MEDFIRHSPRVSLAMIGMNMRQMGTWKTIGQQVAIPQKRVVHTPVERLQDTFIKILADGQGAVKVNLRVRPHTVLLAAFGSKSCADQSRISATLSACRAESVEQMRRALRALYRRCGGCYCHPNGRERQLLGVDRSGLPGGRQGEGVEKGYFAKQKNKRGRQLGGVYGTFYDEIVGEGLYRSKTQLNRSLADLVTDTEKVWNLNPAVRKRTILRLDGGGNVADINWLLARGYMLLVNLDDDQLHWLYQQGKRAYPTPASAIWWTVSIPMTCVGALRKQPSKAPNRACGYHAQQ
jgi:hypothetical protein